MNRLCPFFSPKIVFLGVKSISSSLCISWIPCSSLCLPLPFPLPDKIKLIDDILCTVYVYEAFWALIMKADLTFNAGWPSYHWLASRISDDGEKHEIKLRLTTKTNTHKESCRAPTAKKRVERKQNAKSPSRAVQYKCTKPRQRTKKEPTNER